MQKRDRRARPDQHPHIDTTRCVGQEITHGDDPQVALDREAGIDGPARDMNKRARAANRRGDGRKGGSPVNTDLNAIAITRRRWAFGPASPITAEGGLPADARQTAAVVTPAGALDKAAQPRVNPT